MSDSDLSRRRFLGGVGAIAGSAALGATPAEAKKRPRGARAPHPADPSAALAALMAGNRRYRRGQLTLRDYSPVGERRASAQAPFAAIITCADSRLSPTLIFDVERGNIFVSRVAGNTVDVGTLGSTEYAVAVLGVKVVMVLGHSDCGAVKAAIDVAKGAKSYPPGQYGSIGAFVDPIVPSVQALPPDQRTDVALSTSANARTQAQALAATQPIVAPAVLAGTLRVVAGVYDIATGRVSLV